MDVLLGGVIIITVRNFGDLLINLRTKNHLTKKDLATFIGYTPKQLHRIEKNECIPSMDLVIQLSEFYKINLLQYYKILINDICLDSYMQFSKLRNAIEKADYSLVEILYREYEQLPSFSTGENLKLIYYAKALCCLINKKYEKSLKYCIQGLDYNNIDEIFINISLEKIYSHTTYNLISCIGYSFYFLGETKKYETIMLTLYNNITNHFFSDSYIECLNSKFIFRLYSTILNNLSDLNIKKKEYSIALNFIEKAIKYSTEKGSGLGILDSFYFTKFQCHYYLKQFKEASRSLDYCLTLSMIFKKKMDARHRITSLRITYPNIVDYLKLDELLKRHNLS
ncbi:MAG: helix-turn-helix transcriptional regulator [Clostridium beijerinckii]|nr:helix-turn-helix transcriptional regulator [Clostridium beijerinckii]